MWQRTAVYLITFAICVIPIGCGAEYWTGRIEPVTQVKTDMWGVSFKDTKQNDIRIAGLEVDPATKYLKAEEIIVANHSAEVIAADSERMNKVKEVMQVQVDYQRQLGMNLAMAIAAGGDAASRFLYSLPSIDLGFQSPVASGSGTMRPTSPGTQPASVAPLPAGSGSSQ